MLPTRYMKAAIVVLMILSLGLGVALLVRHNNAVKAKKTDEDRIATLSNRWDETRTRLDEQERLAMFLQTNLTLRAQELSAVSNSFVKVNADLAKTQAEAKAAAEAAAAEVAKRDARITELTTQGDDLTKQIDTLNVSISKLGKSIADTEQKLAASEGDREFLLKELKRLQKEKSDLERQFNDLALLRTQVSKLKDELSIARRLEWIRAGIYGAQTKKGAEILLGGSAAAPARSNFNLNVELKQDGTATVVPNPTNAPPPASP